MPDQDDMVHATSQFFAQRVHAQFDPAVSQFLNGPVVQVTFSGCIMTSPLDVDWAFFHLGQKIEAALAPHHLTNTALLVDIAGLGVTPEIGEQWRRALQQLLGRKCIQFQPGKFRVARYHSRALFRQSTTPHVMRLATSLHIPFQHLDANLSDDRESAIALLNRLGNMGDSTPTTSTQ